MASHGIGPMNEAKSKRLPGATTPAAKLLPRASASAHEPDPDRPPQAANDDQSAWDLVPFPDGWYAGC
jgi:hypothetical protein